MTPPPDRRSPLSWVAPGSALALLAIFAVALQPLLLVAAPATAALGAALALAAPWRRFHAAAPAAREALIESLAPVALTRPVADHEGAPAQPRTRAPTGPVPVTLALQGGGSLGAFTWGVLDRLLDEPAIRVGAVSGASAGAMNAAMLAQGLATGGPAEAKRLLETFWRRVAMASGSPDADGVLFPFAAGLMAPVAEALRHATRGLPRDQVNPLGLNPLRGVLDGLLDPSAFGQARARPRWSSRPPACGPAKRGCSATPRSRRRRCWPRPACRRCSRPWRSTARRTGTAATPPTRRCGRWSRRARPRTSCWSGPRPWSGPTRPRARRASSSGRTRWSSPPRCGRSCARSPWRSASSPTCLRLLRAAIARLRDARDRRRRTSPVARTAPLRRARGRLLGWCMIARAPTRRRPGGPPRQVYHGGPAGSRVARSTSSTFREKLRA